MTIRRNTLLDGTGWRNFPKNGGGRRYWTGVIGRDATLDCVCYLHPWIAGGSERGTWRERVPLLEINQQPGGAPHRYRISVSARNIPDRAALSFDIDIAFELKPEDGERIRWYLEDYLQFDQEPAPQIAKSIEAFMAECGDELFRSIFEGSPDAIRLWSNLEPHLATTRIEINTGIAEGSAPRPVSTERYGLKYQKMRVGRLLQSRVG